MLFWLGLCYYQHKCVDFVLVFADFKNQPSQITVVSPVWVPNMLARRALLVTTLVIYESQISEHVVLRWFWWRLGPLFLARNNYTHCFCKEFKLWQFKHISRTHSNFASSRTNYPQPRGPARGPADFSRARGRFCTCLRSTYQLKVHCWSGVTFKSCPQARVNCCKLLPAKPWTCISFVFLTFLTFLYLYTNFSLLSRNLQTQTFAFASCRKITES